MKLKKIGNNETELTTKEGVQLFFSYETLVAARTMKNVYVTKTKYSNTTTKHINNWLDGLDYELVTQEQLDETFN
jgi:hypothetical protein